MKPIQHPNPGLLMAYLDGECDRATRHEIERHLHQCWRCRSEAAAMERTINGLMREVQKPAWPAEEHQQLAHHRLAARLQHAQQGHAEPPPVVQFSAPRHWFQPRMAGAALAAFLLAVAALSFGAVPFWGLLDRKELWEIPHSRETILALRYAPWEQAETLRRAETGAWRGAHRIRITVPRKQGAERVQTLESLNDGGTGDYHLRLLSAEGRTDYAAWQPGPDPRYAYVYQQRQWGRLTQTNRGAGSAFRSLAAGTAGLEEPGTVSALFDWVQAMVFDSHLPTRRFARLAALPGVTVRRAMFDGRPWVCVRYQEAGVAVDDCLEGDPRSGEVLTERLLIQTHEPDGISRSVDVVIEWAPARPIAASLLYESDFLPPGLRVLELARARRRGPAPSRPSIADDTRRQMLSAALDAEEALLVLSAIEGPEFAVDLELRADAVVAYGRVATQHQYESLEASIRPLTAHSPFLQLEVQVAETAPLPPLGEILPGGTFQDDKPPAAEGLLASRPSLSKEELRDLCNRAVRLSGNVVSAARRLDSLNRRYLPEDIADLTPAELRRLEEIRARYFRHYRLALGDLHQFFVQTGLDSGTAGIPPKPFAELQPTAIYQEARGLHADILHLFAVGHPSEAAATGDIHTVATRLRTLLKMESSLGTTAYR